MREEVVIDVMFHWDQSGLKVREWVGAMFRHGAPLSANRSTVQL